MDKITIYTKSACMHCVNLKKLLMDNGYEFEEKNIDNEEYRQEFVNHYNITKVDSVPLVLVGKLFLVPTKSFKKVSEVLIILEKLKNKE